MRGVIQRKSTGLIAMLILLLLIAGCGQKESAKGGQVLADSEDTETLTTEELYEKAKEEGKVVIYSQSSRWNDIKRTFEEEYPGITVEGYKIDTGDMIEKIIRESDSGLNEVDVVFAKDGAGTFTGELYHNGYLKKYMPEDLTGSMPEHYQNMNGLVPYVEARAIYYNTEAYSEPPVSNWWDLVEPEWKGRVIIGDPLQAADTMDLFLAMIQNPKDMEDAYQQKYGKKLTLSDTENAGYEFIKRLLKNDPILKNSSTDVVNAVGATGQSNPPIGVAVSSKLRVAKEQGLSLGVSYKMEPKLSQAEESLLFMGKDAPHPNAAKLLIRWMAGEADGKGKGLEPFNVEGAWLTRSDITQKEEIPFSEMKLWEYDADFNYKNSRKLRDFWLKLQ